MRVSKNELNISLKREIIRTFIQTIDDLKNFKEKQTFFESFFNNNELETYAKRLSIFYWLKKKKSYQNIKNNLKVSSATIANLEKEIDTDGIKLALKKMEAEEWANKWSEKIKNVKRTKLF
jgi:uncharacterized protein YerC